MLEAPGGLHPAVRRCANARLRAVDTQHAPAQTPCHATPLLYTRRCSFCDANVLDGDQQRVLAAIALEILTADTAWHRTAAESSKQLQDALLKHAIPRPPKSDPTLPPSAAALFFEHMSKLYYRHFKAFKYAIAAVPAATIDQRVVADVEPPAETPALVDAVLVGPLPGAAASAAATPAATAASSASVAGGAR